MLLKNKNHGIMKDQENKFVYYTNFVQNIGSIQRLANKRWMPAIERMTRIIISTQTDVIEFNLVRRKTF